METLGSILKSAREKKGLSIQDLELSTHIVSKYIKALEEEKFDELPGEIYLKGFLKNISDKLGLKADDMLELYRLQKNGMLNTDTSSLLKNQTKPIKVREKKIQEAVKQAQTVRTRNTAGFEKTENIDKKDEITEKEKEKFIEREKEKDNRAIREIQDKKEDSNGNFYSAEETLLMMTRKDIPVKMFKRKRLNVYPIIIVFVIIIISTIAIILFLNKDNFFSMSKNSAGKVSSKKEKGNVQRNIIDITAKQNVKSGDLVYFKPLGISANIKFVSIGNIVRANVNGNEISFSKSNPVLMDLNGNGIDDFRMTLVEVYEDLATVQLEKLEENEMVNNVYTNEQYEPVNTDTQNNQGINNFLVVNGETYLEQDSEKTPIIAEITAKHFVYIRYFIDSNRPATTNLLSGKTLTLEAKDVILLTVGNASEVVVKINGKIISIGEPGETVNKTIKWVKNVNDSTKFNLVVSDTK